MSEFLDPGGLCSAEDPGNVWAFGGPPKSDSGIDRALANAITRFKGIFVSPLDREGIIFIGPSTPLSPEERVEYGVPSSPSEVLVL